MFQTITQKSVMMFPIGAADDGEHSQNEKISRFLLFVYLCYNRSGRTEVSGYPHISTARWEGLLSTEQSQTTVSGELVAVPSRKQNFQSSAHSYIFFIKCLLSLKIHCTGNFHFTAN